ncbi:hypothetical protein V1477_015117 [Vespula maculifrons]|uniref:Uncharacterized protein n=2 Tax=Vespula TaxID=7451 RepID=A0A834JJK2_VESVU|nr:hypothetical protein HZH66_009903 [Vespula vulgaris]
MALRAVHADGLLGIQTSLACGMEKKRKMPKEGCDWPGCEPQYKMASASGNSEGSFLVRDDQNSSSV